MDGKELKEAGLRQVEDNANGEWLAIAIDAVRQIAVDQTELTSDAVWQYLELYWSNIKTHNPSAMGAVMRIAARKGIITPTNQYVTSKRPSTHLRPIRVWKSNY